MKLKKPLNICAYFVSLWVPIERSAAQDMSSPCFFQDTQGQCNNRPAPRRLPEMMKTVFHHLLEIIDHVPGAPEIPGYNSSLGKGVDVSIDAASRNNSVQQKIVNRPTLIGHDETERQINELACEYGDYSECK